MYLRCDGTLTTDVNGVISCTDWVAVTETELLDTVVQQYQLTESQYDELMGWTYLIMIAAFVSRMLIKQTLFSAESANTD